MRRLSKQKPPRNVSHDGQKLRSFLTAEHDYRAELPKLSDPTEYARACFDALDKGKLRQVMYQEQRSLCAYCERRTREGRSANRIDHWWPLSANPLYALHWKNLYLCCSSADTCDGSKMDQPLKWSADDPDLPWPTDYDYGRVVGYTSGGEMYVRNDVSLDEPVRRALNLAISDQHDGLRLRPAILNLNHPMLIAARAAAIDSERSRMEKDFKDRTATRAEREQRANDLLAELNLPEFVSIRTAYLRRTLGHGR